MVEEGYKQILKHEIARDAKALKRLRTSREDSLFSIRTMMVFVIGFWTSLAVLGIIGVSSIQAKVSIILLMVGLLVLIVTWFRPLYSIVQGEVGEYKPQYVVDRHFLVSELNSLLKDEGWSFTKHDLNQWMVPGHLYVLENGPLLISILRRHPLKDRLIVHRREGDSEYEERIQDLLERFDSTIGPQPEKSDEGFADIEVEDEYDSLSEVAREGIPYFQILISMYYETRMEDFKEWHSIQYGPWELGMLLSILLITMSGIIVMIDLTYPSIMVLIIPLLLIITGLVAYLIRRVHRPLRGDVKQFMIPKEDLRNIVKGSIEDMGIEYREALTREGETQWMMLESDDIFLYILTLPYEQRFPQLPLIPRLVEDFPVVHIKALGEESRKTANRFKMDIDRDVERLLASPRSNG
jgi:hypothetical protein